MVEGSKSMNIQIILTDYILKFMYGENTFQDKRLLSLEVIKKAYQEGLYFVSSKKNIDYLVKNNKFKSKNIFLFAGIPSIEEAALDLSIQKVLYAVKIDIPYEILVDFLYDEENRTLRKEKVKLDKFNPVKLVLEAGEKDIFYQETLYDDGINYSFTEEEKTCLLKYFKKDLEEYHYILLKKIEELRNVVVSFLNSNVSLNALDDTQCLNYLAMIYEDLQSCFKK